MAPKLADHIAQAEKILSLNLGWIASADSKVGTYLAISTAMLGALAASMPTLSRLTSCIVLTSSLAALLLIFCIFFLLLATIPRTSGPPVSMVFFGGIAGVTRDKYVRRLASLPQSDYLRDVAAQVHRNAEIAKRKHRFVRFSTYCVLASIIPWLLSIYQIYIHRN